LTDSEGLYLYSNQLSGSIPAELGNLDNLQSLLLWAISLAASIPAELGNLTNLTYLEIDTSTERDASHIAGYADSTGISQPRPKLFQFLSTFPSGRSLVQLQAAGC